jgi:GAF domain-containing protein
LNVKITGIKGPAKGNSWALRGDRLTIGREDECDIFIPDPKISRLHAEIIRRENQYFLIDNKSTNGTFLNGMRITEGALQEGMTVRVGNSEMGIGASSEGEEFSWEDTASTVTASISVDSLKETIERTRTSIDTDLKQALQGDLQLDSVQSANLLKLVKNLETVYQISESLAEVRSIDDILDLTVAKTLEIFTNAERICILVKHMNDPDYRPVKIHTRDEMIGGMEFRISRSIFQKCVDERIGILATDAQHDERFSAAQSIVDIQLRSCLCAPMVVKGHAIGGIYLDNPSMPMAFTQQDLELLTSFATQAGMAYNNAYLYENIQRSYHQSILALINTIEAKDPYTMGHTQRTMRYCVGIGKAMGLNERELETLRTAAQLHDIGKIGVKEQILLKDSPLTDEEFDDIKAHVDIGVKILEPIDYLRDVLPIVKGHHERYDGSGYPDGIKGEEIAQGARILALADAFDAMTTQRPYNKPFSFNQALERCSDVAGKHFDPKCVEALRKYLEENIGGTGHDFGRTISTTGTGNGRRVS